MLGENKLKVSDVATATGINRGTLQRMYHETAERYDVSVLSQLCAYFACAVGDLLEYVEDES